jgi:predicted aspartyl protease
MGTFYADGELVNVAHPSKTARVGKLLVETGSKFTWIPEPILKQAGVKQVNKDLTFVMENGQTITRSTGYAILRAASFETVDEVVFGQPGDLTLLGARTLEGFGARVNPRKKQLVTAGAHPAA